MVWTQPNIETSADVVDIVATKQGVTRDQLPALYEAVEPDALDTLIDHASERPAPDVTIQFEYGGYDVLVSSDGHVELRD